MPVQEEASHPDALAVLDGQAAGDRASFTDHFRDEFLSDSISLAQLGWREALGNETARWRIRYQALEQAYAGHGEHAILKDSLLEQFEFGATMRLLKTEDAEQPAFGLLIQYNEQEALRIRFRQHDGHWTVAVESNGIAPVINRALSLPPTFDVIEWQTLRVVQRHEQLHIALNGAPLLDVLEHARPAQVGLTTSDTAAAFLSVWQTSIA